MVLIDVGDAALVAVVSSSPACLWVCLGFVVVTKSKLQWQGPGGVRWLVIGGLFDDLSWRQPCLVLLSFIVGVRAALSCRRWPSFGADLHVFCMASTVLVGSTSLWWSWSRFLEGWRSPPREAVMTMTLVCYLDETLFVEVCVGFLCMPLSDCNGFHPVFH
jgi:hypothetical protein